MGDMGAGLGGCDKIPFGHWIVQAGMTRGSLEYSGLEFGPDRGGVADDTTQGEGAGQGRKRGLR